MKIFGYFIAKYRAAYLPRCWSSIVVNVRWHLRVLRRPQVQVVRQGTQSNQGDSSSEGGCRNYKYEAWMNWLDNSSVPSLLIFISS